jgi:homoserine kinase
LIWSERAVRVRAPATSANLGPGFDALGLALGLYDEVVARIVGDGVSVAVSGEGADTTGLGERHLVVRAMRAAFGAMGAHPPGIRLACLNTIPHGRGLGSSAAAICSGLHAARALVADGPALLPDEELFRLAVDLEGHPDNVAACLAGGLVIAWRPVGGGGTGGTEGTGSAGGAGRARLLRLGVAGGLSTVVCVPPVPLATHEARRVLPSAVPHAEAAANAARAALLIAALTGEVPAGSAAVPGGTGEVSVLFAATEDFLHQPYRAAVMPETADLLGRLRKAGLAAVVSGAGPGVLVLSVSGEPAGQEIPEVVDSIARETGITWRVIPLDIDRLGVTVQPVGMDAHQSGSARQGRPWSQAPVRGVRHAGGSPQDRPVSSASHGPPSGECRGLLGC